MHVDFLLLTPGKPVIISIPVKLEGVSAGVLKGGKIDKKLRKLKVKAMQEHLPDELIVRIDDLDIGGVIKVGAMSLENVEFLDTPSSVIVMVKSTRVVVETVEGAAGAPPAGAKK